MDATDTKKPPRNWTLNLGQLALEVFSIVPGVLLALAVFEWHEDRNNQERAAVAAR